jgi:hypothetical protein
VLHPSWLPCPACKGRGFYLPTFAANHFVRCEPCAELARQCGVTVLPGQMAKPGPRIGWIIVGGESGPNARPMHPDWARSLRDQCTAAGVPLFFKQWGGHEPLAGHPVLHPKAVAGGVQVATFPDGVQMARVGKAAAGRLLDGVEHNGFPVTGAQA